MQPQEIRLVRSQIMSISPIKTSPPDALHKCLACIDNIGQTKLHFGIRWAPHDERKSKSEVFKITN